ncbi:MAG: hypothetical protein ACE5HE_09480 [Phycisphaerae bacterium]
MRLQHRINVLMVSAALSVTSVCLAVDPTPTEARKEQVKVPTSPAASATIEQILERAVQNIARRYNLNQAQTQFTDELMKTEVNKFLLEHEDEVWPVIRDLLSAQALGGPPDDVELMKRIGRAAGPLAELAQKAIFKANDEWRQILTDEQKALHDYDLSEMEKNFDEIHNRLRSWAQGKKTDDGGILPGPETPGAAPPRPGRPPEKPLPDRPAEAPVNIPTLFDTRVEEFIKEFRLDESQIETARSILKEFKAKASDIKNAQKHEFSKLASEQRSAIEKRDRAKLKEVEAARKKLLEPVYELFAQMETRLRGLLTTLQLEQHSAHKQASAAEVKKRAARKRAASPTTTPADAQRQRTSPKKKQPVTNANDNQ